MKKICYPLLTVIVLYSCATSGYYTKQVDQDIALKQVLKKLEKKSSDKSALEALPVVYTQAREKHLKAIAFFGESKQDDYEHKIIDQYILLQNLHLAIIKSAVASSLVTPVSYEKEIANARQSAAEQYYIIANDFSKSGKRDDQIRAMKAFKNCMSFLNNYKDSKSRMQQAYDSAFVKIAIYPLINNPSPNLNNFEARLCKELALQNNNLYPAKYFTAEEAQQKNIEADWAVYVAVNNVEMEAPVVSTTTNNYTNKVVNGRDSLGRNIYETVYGSVDNETASYASSAEINIDIIEVNTGKFIYSNIFAGGGAAATFTRTYTGDPRAGGGSTTGINIPETGQQQPMEKLLTGIKESAYLKVKEIILATVAGN
jgi:hypothetical protein